MRNRYFIIAVGATVIGTAIGAWVLSFGNVGVLILGPFLVAIAMAIVTSLVTSASWRPKEPAAESADPSVPTTAMQPGQFKLQSMLLAVTIIAILLGAWRISPILAIILFVVWATTRGLRSSDATQMETSMAMAFLVFFSVFAALFTVCTMGMP